LCSNKNTQVIWDGGSTSYLYTWIYYCTHQYFLIFFETKHWKFLLNLILDWDLVISTIFFLLWVQNMKIYLWYFLQIFILLNHCNYFWRIMFWTRKVNFWSETYLSTPSVRCTLWWGLARKDTSFTLGPWTRSSSSSSETYLHLLNNVIRVELENPLSPH
jgi:hypothetical protein